MNCIEGTSKYLNTRQNLWSFMLERANIYDVTSPLHPAVLELEGMI